MKSSFLDAVLKQMPVPGNRANQSEPGKRIRIAVLSVIRLILGLVLSLVAPLAGNSQKLYWANSGTGAEALWRSNLDGTEPELILAGTTYGTDTVIGKLSSIAINSSRTGLIYTGEKYNPSYFLRRMNLDGSGLTNLIVGTPVAPAGLALDAINEKVYWTHAYGTTKKIRRVNLDGSGLESLCDAPGGSGIALDVAGGKMYWAQNASITGVVMRANLDGSGIVALITGLDGPSGVALDLLSRQIYWVTSGQGAGSGWNRGQVQVADMDGTNIQTLYTAPAHFIDRPGNIVLDRERGKLYVGSYYDNSLRVFNVDGSGSATLISGSPTVSCVVALALYLPPPRGTIFTGF